LYFFFCLEGDFLNNKDISIFEKLIKYLLDRKKKPKEMASLLSVEGNADSRDQGLRR
jgi:hypothetical protein